ncbi:MAG: hypothetical protein ACK4R2_03715 [Roseateles sp.]
MNRLLATAVTALLLTGCAGPQSFTAFEPATPADYTGPTVNVADQAIAVDPQRLHIFEITQVDGRRLASSSTATQRAGQGRGMTVTPVALTNELAVRPARVQLQATTQYASPVVALSRPTCRTVGEVGFTPQAGARYVVKGRIAAAAGAVWIADGARGPAVTAMGRGRARPRQ